MSPQDPVAQSDAPELTEAESPQSTKTSNKWEEVLKEDPQAQETESTEAEIVEAAESSVSAEDYAALKKELAEAHEEKLYLQAELQTAKRRAALDLEKERKFSSEKTIAALFPFMDSCEKSLEQATTFEQFQEGTRHLIALLHSIFEKLGVKVINPEVGEAFNPHLHSAVATEEVEEEKQAPNTIVKLFQKGYTLHERVVRPAMVIVSKAKEEKAE